jgi:serine/threonine protein kinase
MIELQQYVLQTKVHEGPDTSLYEGQRTADGLQIVGKLLKSPYPSPRDAARIRHEYSLLKDLVDVPGIPRPLALERYGNSLVIITERVAGKPLNEVMKQRTLDLSSHRARPRRDPGAGPRPPRHAQGHQAAQHPL